MVLPVSIRDEFLCAKSASELFLAGVRPHVLKQARFMLKLLLATIEDALKFALTFWLVRLVKRIAHESLIHFFDSDLSINAFLLRFGV